MLRNKDNGRYSSLDLGDVSVRIMPPYDPTQAEQQPLTTLRLPVSLYGTADGSYKLPADAQPGYYSIDIAEQSASLSFQVAEYRKPEFDLQVAFDKPAYQKGEPLSASVSAAYFFDAPVSDLPLTWNLYSRPDYVFLPDGLQAGAMDNSWMYPRDRFAPGVGEFIAQGQAQTGPDGKLAIDIPADALANLTLTNRRTLVLEVTAVDETNLSVSARAEAALHPASFYIGVRADSWSAQAGEEIGFDLQTLDWENQPAGAHTLSAVFSRVEWVQEGDQNSIYGYPTYKKVLTEISSTDLRTDGLGRARAAFTPPDPGTYQLEVSGEARCHAVVSLGGRRGAGALARPAQPAPAHRSRRRRIYPRRRPPTSASPTRPGQTTLALVTVERGTRDAHLRAGDKAPRWQSWTCPSKRSTRPMFTSR